MDLASLTQRDLNARLGTMAALAGVKRIALVDGPDAGGEQIEVRTGAGLRYVVSAHRGLDIALAEFGGFPLSWHSASGDGVPHGFAGAGLGWLRTAAGGLLMTCGLTQVGSPCEDAGEALGIHGWAHHTPARAVAAWGEWVGGRYVTTVRGEVRQARLFGENLVLRRRITSELGRNALVIDDAVTNEGGGRSPLMVLYHFNFGWPLMSEATRVEIASGRVEPREAETPVAGWDSFEPPNATARERVYYHHDLATAPDAIDGRPMAQAIVRQPAFPMAGGGTRAVAVRLRWTHDTLARLVQWRMPGHGAYVLGIEPANCHVGGRAAERAAGTLLPIEPGETVSYRIELDITAG